MYWTATYRLPNSSKEGKVYLFTQVFASPVFLSREASNNPPAKKEEGENHFCISLIQKTKKSKQKIQKEILFILERYEIILFS